MARYLCHDQPDLMALEARVLDTRPGAVLLDRTPAYPGGGGQLADRARLIWNGGEASVIGFEADPRGYWHVIEGDHAIGGAVTVAIDPDFRRLMCELHTVSHVVNNLVFHAFDGALVTGVQMSGEGSFRMDFDIPGADNDRLKALDPVINAALRKDCPVRQVYVPMTEAESEPGLIRSKAVTPPQQPDGTVRIIDIVGLDRQACGGTHLGATGEARPFRILKIDNKGRQNRRLKVGVAALFPA